MLYAARLGVPVNPIVPRVFFSDEIMSEHSCVRRVRTVAGPAGKGRGKEYNWSFQAGMKSELQNRRPLWIGWWLIELRCPQEPRQGVPRKRYCVGTN
jgi:hypothetical protein